MVELNEDETRRQEIGLKFKNDQLNDAKEIEYFLEQFKDGQYALGDDDLLKVAELAQKNPDEVTKSGAWRNFFTKGRRTQKAKNIKKQMDKITNLESKRSYDMVATSLKYDGLPVTEEGKQNLKDLQDATREKIAELGAKGAKNWFMHPRLRLQQYRAKRNLKAITKPDRIAKLQARIAKFKEKSALENRAGSKLNSVYYSVRASLAGAKLNRLDPLRDRKEKAAKQAQMVQNLEATVAGSKFYRNLGSKWKLGFARLKNNYLQKREINKTLGNDLLANKMELDLEIVALRDRAVITKTDKKRRDAALATKMKLQAKIEKRLSELNANKSKKENKITTNFDKDLDKAMAIITKKAEGIDRKNERLDSHTLEGKVRKALLSQVSAEKRAELEGVLNARDEKAITADADFKKFLEKAGFKKQDIEKLQGLITSYSEKGTKAEKVVGNEEAPVNEAEPVNEVAPSKQAIVNSDTSVNEYKQIIENDEKKTVILEKSLDAEMKARCIAAALTVEDAKIKNMPMIEELRIKGANVAELEAAREKSIKEKNAALTPDRRQELRELSVASKVVKMDDVAYKAFKESDLKTASPEQIKLLDNMRLPKDSEAYNKLSPEDKGKVGKASKDVDSLNKNKERQKILKARGVVPSDYIPRKENEADDAYAKRVKKRDEEYKKGLSTAQKKEFTKSRNIIKENQAQRQFR